MTRSRNAIPATTANMISSGIMLDVVLGMARRMLTTMHMPGPGGAVSAGSGGA